MSKKETTKKSIAELANAKIPTVKPFTKEEQIKAIRTDAIIRAVLWAFVFVGGIIATVISYSMAANSRTGNQSYFIFWGAILFGFIRFCYWLYCAANPESRIKKK